MTFRLLLKDIKFIFARKLGIFAVIMTAFAFLIDYQSFVALPILILPSTFKGADKDAEFCALLPATKRQVFLSKILFMAVVEMFAVAMCAVSALISPVNPLTIKAPNLLDGLGAVGLLLGIFTIVNSVYCLSVRGRLSFSDAFTLACAIILIGCGSVLTLSIGSEFSSNPVLVTVNSALNSGTVTTVMFCSCAALYLLMTFFGYKSAVRKYESRDYGDFVKITE